MTRRAGSFLLYWVASAGPLLGLGCAGPSSSGTGLEGQWQLVDRSDVQPDPMAPSSEVDTYGADHGFNTVTTTTWMHSSDPSMDPNSGCVVVERLTGYTWQTNDADAGMTLSYSAGTDASRTAEYSGCDDVSRNHPASPLPGTPPAMIVNSFMLQGDRLTVTSMDGPTPVVFHYARVAGP